jgi:membrane-associated phospholipid phosphatase
MDRWLSRRALPLAILLFLLVTAATAVGVFGPVDSLATELRLRLPHGTVAWLSAPFVVAGSVGATATAVVALGLLMLRRRPRLALGLVSGYLLANLIELAVKFTFTHPNPPNLGHGGSPVPDLFLLHLLTDANIGLLPSRILLDSYPSGHTARIVLLCLVTAAAWPSRRLRCVMAVFVFLLALALVLGGSHWPSDVLGGACLGWICAAIANRRAPISD